MTASSIAPRCGRFLLRKQIGKGGMGEIFLADDPVRGRRVALKRLSPSCAKDERFVAMFLDEARLVSRMRHRNVCEVYEHGTDGDHYFLVMELVDGHDLAHILRHRRFVGLPFPLACRVAAEVASALEYAHHMTDEHGAPLAVVHRDVSPANVMIARDGRVKLVDFGLARARTQLMKTLPGHVKGKFGYLAPEQIGGQADFRTDLFGLGLCLYEALVGRPFFDQKTAAETVRAVKALAAPPTLSDRIEGIPREIDDLIARLLAPSPADRYPSAAAARAALGSLVVRAGHTVVTARDLANEIARSLSSSPVG